MALSAIRNLNGHEIKKRQIRVNFTSNDMTAENDKDDLLMEEDYIDSDGNPQKKINIKTCLENSIDHLNQNEKFFLVLQLKELYETDREKLFKLLTANSKLLDLVQTMQTAIDIFEEKDNIKTGNKVGPNHITQNRVYMNNNRQAQPVPKQTKSDAKNLLDSQGDINTNNTNQQSSLAGFSQNLLQLTGQGQSQVQNQGNSFSNMNNNMSQSNNTNFNGNPNQYALNRTPPQLNNSGPQPPGQINQPQFGNNNNSYLTNNMINNNSQFSGINPNPPSQYGNLSNTHSQQFSPYNNTNQNSGGFLGMNQNRHQSQLNNNSNNPNINHNMMNKPGNPNYYGPN